MNKRLMAALLAACICISLMAGCSSREEAGESDAGEAESTVQEVSEGSPNVYTSQAAAENNAKITDDDVVLVQFAQAAASEPVATIKTTEGDIRIRLFPEQAPKAVDNFVRLAEAGYFNAMTFHEVIAGNLIHTGDPTGTSTGGASAFATDTDKEGYFEDEFSLDLWHFRGAVSMWNDGANRNTSQFFIVQNSSVSSDTVEKMREQNHPAKVIAKYEEVGGLPAKDWRNTVFGMVADDESMAVVDRIAAVPVQEGDGGKYTPVDPVLVESVTVEGIVSSPSAPDGAGGEQAAGESAGTEAD